MNFAIFLCFLIILRSNLIMSSGIKGGTQSSKGQPFYAHMTSSPSVTLIGPPMTGIPLLYPAFHRPNTQLISFRPPLAPIPLPSLPYPPLFSPYPTIPTSHPQPFPSPPPPTSSSSQSESHQFSFIQPRPFPPWPPVNNVVHSNLPANLPSPNTFAGQRFSSSRAPSSCPTRRSNLVSSDDSIHCEHQSTFIFPHEGGNCRKFQMCAHNQVYTFDCAPGTVFNPRLLVCDHPNRVPSCFDQSTDIYSKPNGWNVSRSKVKSPSDANRMRMRAEPANLWNAKPVPTQDDDIGWERA